MKTVDAGGQLVPDLNKLKDARKLEIERLRDRKLVAPTLVYDGKTLDADRQSKENLADVLAEATSYIAKGQEMPAQKLVWKDYYNQYHVFPDTATYKDWLDGFVIAFGDRNTEVWAWSWQKKAELEAATTPGEIAAIDLN